MKTEVIYDEAYSKDQRVTDSDTTAFNRDSR